jgi:2-polyprenyl-3-methyl-5-hydroxy-6-metoxy-1,4-benzoquinol methylase
VGHLREKYTDDYFLGGIDPVSGRPYGVLGHQEFHAGGIHERNRGEFDITASFVGSMEGKDVLDIGIGRGERIPLYLEAGARHYYGIDFSPSSIAIAAKRFSSEKVTFELCDAKDLRTDLMFDIVVFYNVIEHVPVFEMEVVWHKIRKVLSPGGFVLFSTPLFDDPNKPDHTELNFAVMGIHCHKQTLATVTRTCLRYGFMLGMHTDRCYGLYRTSELHLLPEERKEAFISNHEGVLKTLGLSIPFDLVPTQEQIRSIVPGIGRMLIGCVVDNRPETLAEALRLVQSIRWFGGSIAGANIMVCVIDDADPEYREELERWGAFVRIFPVLSYFSSEANKLRLFDAPEIFAYDTVVLLDAGTLVVQDPQPYLDGKLFQAKPAGGMTAPAGHFRALLDHYGLSLPDECPEDRSPWEIDTGVLVFPKPAIDTLVPLWKKYSAELVERQYLWGDADFSYEQDSLALALVKAEEAGDFPFASLPLAMNFPLHRGERNDSDEMTVCDPVIIHYRDLADAEGYLGDTPDQPAKRKIALFNEKLREYRKRRFLNRMYWDLHYSREDSLRLGADLQGPSLPYKQQVVRQFVGRFGPLSTLDIGCGDGLATMDVQDELYTGIDISPVVVDRNRTRLPQRKYLLGDFVDKRLPRYELTLCFDVVIHLDSTERYREFVSQVLNCTAGHGVISGYEEEPVQQRDITFFHEPLSETLRNAGARNLRCLGKYGDLTLWQFEPPRVPGQDGSPALMEELRHLRAIENSASWKMVRKCLDFADKSVIPEGTARRRLAYSLLRTRPVKVPDLPASRSLSRPVFIVGCMRSGTTLLAKLLGRSAEIVYCGFELREIWSKTGKVPMASQKTRDERCPALGEGDATEQLASLLGNAFRERLISLQAGKAKDAVFLTKNPHLCNKLPFVKVLFPDARFIWISRGLHDVVASLKGLFSRQDRGHDVWYYWPEKTAPGTRCWNCFFGDSPPPGIERSRCFPGGDVKYLAEYWLESNLGIADFGDTMRPDEMLTLSAEELVSDTKATMARCLAFFGAALEPSLLENQDMDPGRNGRWRDILSPAEIRSLSDFEGEFHTEIGKVARYRERT